MLPPPPPPPPPVRAAVTLINLKYFQGKIELKSVYFNFLLTLPPLPSPPWLVYVLLPFPSHPLQHPLTPSLPLSYPLFPFHTLSFPSIPSHPLSYSLTPSHPPTDAND